MRALFFLLVLSGLASGATYRGQNIDGKDYSATTRILGEVVAIRVQFSGKTVRVVMDGKVIEMELDSEEIKDPSAIRAHDGRREWVLNVLDIDC